MSKLLVLIGIVCCGIGFATDEDSPFTNMGIRQGDILTTVNDVKLEDAASGEQAFRSLSETQETPVSVTVIRDGEEVSIPAPETH